jgi:hypothetical protein
MFAPDSMDMLSIVLFVVTICMREQQSLCYYQRLHGKHRALHRLAVAS